MGHRAKWEYFRAIYERYHEATRKLKHAILNEFCLNTGYHRKYAIRVLNGAPPGKQPRRRRRRGLSYSHEVLSILTAVWEAAGCLVGAAESVATAVDAVDPKAVPCPPAD